MSSTGYVNTEPSRNHSSPEKRAAMHHSTCFDIFKYLKSLNRLDKWEHGEKRQENKKKTRILEEKSLSI